MSTCILTGGGSGIGKATAILLAKEKKYDHYALLGRNREAIEATISEMKEYTLADYIDCDIDLAFPDRIPEVVDDIYNRTGSVDCLLNIAGYTDPQPLLTTSLESFEATYKINVFAPFMLIRECVRYMKQSGGKILNVASTAGMTPRPGWLSYSSSKASVISMSKTLTEELSEYGIKVYCISPGRCATKLRKKLAPDEDPSTIMQPEDVAGLIVKLISPDEECLDGQNIIIRKQIK